MREVLTGLAERRLVGVAEARFAEEPVLVLNGPRTVGKSTLLGQLAGRLGRPVIDCDDPATRSAVRADPGRFVESAEPVLIDEYQHVPELLDAIKAQLNRDLRPGRYVLAGSTRYAAIPAAAQALTGRARLTESVRPSLTNFSTATTLRDRRPARRLPHERNTLGERHQGGCQWPCAARRAGRVPGGSPPTWTW
jgi:predicted AAA+ superfamily ATPase